MSYDKFNPVAPKTPVWVSYISSSYYDEDFHVKYFMSNDDTFSLSDTHD